MCCALENLAQEIGLSLQMRDEEYGSDHEMLAACGVPGICFTREGPRSHTIHTAEDTIEWLAQDVLWEIGVLVDCFLSRILDASDWPFARSVPARFTMSIRAREARLGMKPSLPTLARKTAKHLMNPGGFSSLNVMAAEGEVSKNSAYHWDSAPSRRRSSNTSQQKLLNTSTKQGGIESG